jgi:hypothetical protein
MNAIAIKITKILIKNELEGAIEFYEKLDKEINNTIRRQILSKISKKTDEEIIYILFEYFAKYKIEIDYEHEEEPKKKKTAPRAKESKENIKKRQKAFIERKKDTGAKKLQIYISAEAHDKLKSLKESENLTYSELIENLIIQKCS